MKIEARTLVFMLFLLSFSVIISNFDILILILVIPIVLMNFNIIKTFRYLNYIPILLLTLLSLKIDWKMIVGVTVLFLLGVSLILNFSIGELYSALVFFRVPKHIAFMAVLSLKFFEIALNDLRNIWDIKKYEEKNRFRRILEVTRGLASISVLRAIAMTEILYSRGFNVNKINVSYKNLEFKDYLALIYSLVVLVASLIIKFGKTSWFTMLLRF